MTDFYLKFASEEEARTVLYSYVTERDYERQLTEEELAANPDNFPIKTSLKPIYANIDTLGVIYERPPVDAGEDYEPVALQGWHVNVRLVDGEDGSALQPFAVVPTQPRRIWG